MRKQLLKSLLILFLTVLISFVFAQLSPVQAAEYYVAGDTGVDTNPGTTSQPWRTIQKAADVMVAGDTVNVKGGVVYVESSIRSANAGTSTNYISYRAWPGTGVPIIDTNLGNGFWHNKQYQRMSGFHLKNVAGKGFDGGNMIITNNIVEMDDWSFAGAFSGGSSTIIANNIFIGSENRSTTQSGVAGVNFSQIQNNIFINLTNGVEAFGSLGNIQQNLFYSVDQNCKNCTLGSGNIINEDPLFSDFNNTDYTLLPNSPAINAGADLSAYGVTTDILGRARPNAGAFDIGAYEDPNIYVAGDVEVSGNGSMGSPFKTIQEAADVTTAGDTVNIKGSLIYANTSPNLCLFDSGPIYAVLCISNSGSTSLPITYKGWSGTGIPIIDAQHVNRGVALNSAGNIGIDGIHIKDPASNIVIGNGNNGGCIRGRSSSGASFAIKNSILENCRETPYDLRAVGILHFLSNTVLYSRPQEYDAWLLMTSSSSSIIDNNLFLSNGHLNEYYYNALTNISFSNNFFYDISNTGIIYFSFGENLSNVNPFLRDIANGDFRLQPNSPAINAGTDVSAYGVNKDILSVPRPQGAGYDIGAFEFYSVPVSITSPTGAYVTTASPIVSGSASTISGATITKVQYSLNDGAWTNASGNFSFTLNNLSQGSHTIRVRATDSYGNQTHESQYATKTFVVDSITPTIKLTKLGLISNLPDKSSLTYYFTSQTPKIEGGTDSNSTVTFETGVETYVTQADNNGNFIITLNTPKLPRGQNLISYKSTDPAGNVSEARTLKLVIGEEYFPEWVYGPVVTEGQNIEDINQNKKQEEIKKETEDKEYPKVTTYVILVKDKEEKPIIGTKVEIGGKYYTTDEEGKITIPITTGTVLRYEIEGVLGEFLFNPDKKINEIIVEIPPKSEGIKMEGKEFNWLWLVISLILLLGSGAWYSYNKRKI